MHSGRNPIPTTFATTIAMTVITLLVTTVALHLAGIPFLPIMLALTITMPLMLTPMLVYPLLAMNHRQQELSAILERQTLTDGLTELPNRRAFFEFAGTITQKNPTNGTPLVAMMIDVDHFKDVNDNHGHDAGDLALKRVAGVIRDEVAASGASDWIVARLGGEEFAVIACGLVPTAVARLAERICGQVHHWVGAGVKLEPVTVSVGVAFRAPAMSIDKLLKAADDAVYAAKRGGRDRWAFAGDVQNDGERRAASKPLPEPANDRLAAS